MAGGKQAARNGHKACSGGGVRRVRTYQTNRQSLWTPTYGDNGSYEIIDSVITLFNQLLIAYG
jgi:hypothetical protein